VTVRVVIADDHSMVREGLQALLSSVGGYEVVALASTGAAAVRETVTHRPDVLVLDIGMPELNGIEVARRVTKSAPNVNILMLTMFDDDDSVLAAIRAGALGYVLKGASADEIMRAIVAVTAGEAIFGPGLACAQADQLRAGRASIQRADPAGT
jgi:DNA-binding NarL/FixJ family response regulator